MSIYIVYDLKSTLSNFDPTVRNCLFGAVKLIKISDIDKYEYAGYGIGFVTSHPSGGTGVNLLVFGADMSSSVHANNKTKVILIHGEGFTQGLEHATLYAEKVYPINFTAAKKILCLSLHFNGDNSYLFANGTDY